MKTNTPPSERTIYKCGSYFSFPFCFFLMMLFIFIERGREGEREGETHQCVVASHAPLLGTWSTTQACALTGD